MKNEIFISASCSFSQKNLTWDVFEVKGDS